MFVFYAIREQRTDDKLRQRKGTAAFVMAGTLRTSVRHGHLVATSVILRRHGLRLHWWGGIVPHSHAGAASAADSSCVHSLWTVLRSGFSRHRSHLSPFWSYRHMTSIRSVSVLATAAFALIATSSASADVVTSTFSGIGSGTWSSGIYSGQSFTNKAFTFTTSVETSSISAFSAGFLAPVAAATVFIEDYGDLAITSATEQAVNQQQRRFGFGLAGSGAIVFVNNNAFGSWNMQTNLGPITGSGSFNTTTFNTSLGAIQFSGSPTITFTSVVPAPGAVALVGLAGLAGSRRRRA